MTAVAANAKAVISVKVNGAVHTNGTSATWLPGINIVQVTVKRGTTQMVYTVTVTNTGAGLGSLTVTSEAGASVGDTKITVSEELPAGHSYRYKTAPSVDLPSLDDELSDWDEWDGQSDITATDGDEIVIATVALGALAKAAGKTTVVSNTGV